MVLRRENKLAIWQLKNSNNRVHQFIFILQIGTTFNIIFVSSKKSKNYILVYKAQIL
jgi:hypothetical protein